jgi:hypothetical protein
MPWQWRRSAASCSWSALRTKPSPAGTPQAYPLCPAWHHPVPGYPARALWLNSSAPVRQSTALRKIRSRTPWESPGVKLRSRRRMLSPVPYRKWAMQPLVLRRSLHGLSTCRVLSLCKHTARIPCPLQRVWAFRRNVFPSRQRTRPLHRVTIQADPESRAPGLSTNLAGAPSGTWSPDTPAPSSTSTWALRRTR